MRVAVSPVPARPIAMPPAPAIESALAHSPLQAFCRLQIGQVLSQLPGAGVHLVYQAPDQSKRQSFQFGRECWSILDAKSRTYLASEVWWTENSIGYLKQVLVKPQCRFYACSLSQNKLEYLLVATTKPLTTSQKQFIRSTAALLSHHLSTVRELQKQQQSYQQLEYKHHQIEHQVKSPIALIQIYTEILLSTALEQPARSHLSSIQASIQDISRHLKQLSIKQKSLRIEQHDLSQILTQSINQLQPWLTEKQTTVNYSRAPLWLDVDAWQLKQVFDNLIANAIYFSPDRSTIDCTWSASPQEVLIEVSDQGAGLSEADLEQIFTPFYSRRPEGTGLGLTIAQKIVQAHQGSIWVSNLPTGGARFSFTLPRQQPKLSIVPTLQSSIL